ncbi:hypothetical protein J437_LFUL016698 [Ladona fulva]|uniref:Integrase catalytic domain-containing protein n=1 Tax=Ladona fulva TaxID=123851 RepID=A0A8K0PAN1_LADFU|nr:hypothetical protein J437_LFUL016698 [Ladona fulva]
MRRRVKKYIAACVECTYHKRPGGKREGALHTLERVSSPFHTVHIDHLGPFPKSKRGNEYILAYQENQAVRNTRTKLVCEAVSDIFSVFGCPERLISDRGTAFTSREFEELCESHQIKHIKTATATPRANGQVERSNAVIVNTISTMSVQEDRSDWDVSLKDLQFAMNSMLNKTTGRSEHELVCLQAQNLVEESKVLPRDRYVLKDPPGAK